MDRLSELLNYIQKTNLQTTRQKLIEELTKNKYYALVLMMICENEKKMVLQA